jgi:hypothetical protein
MRFVPLALACATLLAAVSALSFPSAIPGSLVERAHSTRSATTDLEIGGDLRGLPPGSTRYLGREDLQALTVFFRSFLSPFQEKP